MGKYCLPRGSIDFQSWQIFFLCVSVLVLTACTTQQPTQQWKVLIDGKGGPRPITANVTVDADRVYIATYERNDSVNWSEQHYLQAFDRLTGRPDWRTNIGGFHETRPIVDDQNVYLMSEGAGLYAIDRESGQQRWFRPLAVEETTSPSLDQSNLYIWISKRDDSSGATTGQMLTVNRITGDIVAEKTLPSSMLVAFRQVFYINDNYILSLDTATDTSTTVFTSPERLTGLLTNDSANLYITTFSRLLVFNPVNKAVDWEFSIPTGIPEAVVTTDDSVYVTSRVDQNPHSTGTGVLYAIDKATHQLRWSQPFESGIGVNVTDSRVFVTTGQKIHVLSVRDGKSHWTYACEQLCFTPSVIDRTMYVADLEGTLSMFLLPEYRD